MQTVPTRERETLSRIVRRMNRKASYELIGGADGEIEMHLALGSLRTQTRFTAAALEAAMTDAVAYEQLRGKIKRVYDRMLVPRPPAKMPKVEIQRDLAHSFASHRRGGRR